MIEVKDLRKEFPLSKQQKAEIQTTEKVSVANNTLIRPFAYNSSITSFKIGNKPE